MPQGVEKEDGMAESNDTTINRRSYLKMVGAGAGFSAGGTGLTSLGTQSVRAHQESPCNTVDDFEDSDLSEYEFDQGSSGASLVTSPTYSGAYALEISGTNTEMISMEGLEHYPAAGDVFSTWLQGANGADQINISYGVQNHINRYIVRVDFENDELAIWRHEDGTSHVREKKTSGFTLSQDTWYEVQVEWKTDGTHALTLFDENGNQITELSATDPTWTAGGIGYDAYLGDGGAVYFDHMQVKSGREIVSANEIIDSFEDSDLAEYDFDQGSAGASVVSSPTYGGSSVLEISGTNTELISTSGLDHYPSAGDVFSCWVRGTGGAEDVHLTYGVQDHDSRYFARIDIANNDLFLFKYDNGNFDQLAEDGSVSLVEDTWYNIEVDWRKTGTHIVTVYDCDGKEVAQITGSDSTWTSGGIGYDAYLESSGGTVLFDYVAIHSSVLDDFEDGDMSEYSGDTGSFTVQNSTVLEGNQTLKGTNAPGTITHTNLTTLRGNEYETTVLIPSGSGAKPAIVGCIQDPNEPLSDCYYATIDPVNDTLSLYRQDSGTTTLLEEASVTVNEGTEYRLALLLDPTMVAGILRDANGNDLEVAGEHDRTYYDGYFGIRVENSAPSYFDSLRERPWISFTDTFEDNSLSEYTGDTAAYTIQSSTVLAGSQTLKAENNYTEIAHETAETSRGNGYKCTIQAGSNSESRPGLLACVQNTDAPTDDCYWAQASSDNDNLNLFLRQGGSTTVLDRVNVMVEKGKTYQLGLELRDRKVKANLYSENGVLLAETSLVSDTTYSSGNLGFYTGGSSAPAYYDNLIEIPLTVDEKHSVGESNVRAQSALGETLTQEVLTELNDPSTSPADATRENVYTNGTFYKGNVVKIPMEYGKLHVVYREGSVELAEAVLNRSTMPSSLVDDLSDSFDWPSSEAGAVVNHKFGENLDFMRSVTDSERSEIKSLITDHDGRTDEPGKMMVMNNDGGWYRATYYDKAYDVNDTIDSVEYEDEIVHTPDTCSLSRAGCAVGGVTTAVSVKAAGLSCGSMLLSAGGSAPACGLSLVGLGGSATGTAISCAGAELSCPD